MIVRSIRPDEHERWLDLRERLWPDTPREDLARDRVEILEDPEQNAVLLAEADGGEVVGFVEVRLRDWAEGCESRPVGYIEAWYVEPSHRRSGVGRLLVEAAERWAIDRGCTEMGSDADLENTVSHDGHRALGYEEVGRQVLFRKTLKP